VEPISQQDPSAATPAEGAEPADAPSARGLDPVDLAMMLKTQKASGAGSGSKRYAALAMVVVAFIVLVAMGLWMAAHVHGGTTPANGALGPVRVVAALTTG